MSDQPLPPSDPNSQPIPGQPPAQGQVVAVNVGSGGLPPVPRHGGVTALGVIATVFGSIALLGSFIPCFGMLAIYLAIPAAICGIIGIVMAKSKQVSMALSIVGTVLSVVGGMISGFQIAAFSAGTSAAAQELEELGEEIDKELKEQREENEERMKERNNTPDPVPPTPSNNNGE